MKEFLKYELSPNTWFRYVFSFMSSNIPEYGKFGIIDQINSTKKTIPVIKADFIPAFSRRSFSISTCSLSSSKTILYFSVWANSSSFLYFPIFGAIIFSIIIVPTTEIIIEAAIIKNKFEVRAICVVSSIKAAALFVYSIKESSILPTNIETP